MESCRGGKGENSNQSCEAIGGDKALQMMESDRKGR